MTNSSFRVASSLILLLILGSWFSVSDASAAADDRRVVLDRVEMDQIKLDKMGTNRGSSPTATGKWILVEFSYEVKPDPEKEKSTHLDEVQFKVSVEGSDGEGRKSDKTVILSGEVTYMAVPVGKGFGSMYIPADVAAIYHIDRYMSNYNVNVQAFVGGQLVDSKDKKSGEADNWFARPDFKNIPGMLLNKQQSPFVVNDTDRYPTIKPKQGN